MANLKEIRGRIGSVKNTRKITSAMGRIASARLVKTQNLKASARPYGERMQEVVGELVAELSDDEGPAHPLLRETESPKTTLIVLVTADRGLCGGFNANASRCAFLRAKEIKGAGQEVELFCVGKKGASNLRHRGFTSVRNFDAPSLDSAISLANEVAAVVRDRFLSGEVDRVEVVYNHFTNVITQTAKSIPLLPVPAQGQNRGDVSAASAERIFEPSREALLDTLLPMAVDTMVQQTMFNSMASEVAARRTAMDNATDNASQLIDDLTLIYNRERQAAITTELMEIIGGAEALKGS